MMILAILRNFTILGVGVAIMDINQNVSIVYSMQKCNKKVLNHQQMLFIE